MHRRKVRLLLTLLLVLLLSFVATRTAQSQPEPTVGVAFVTPRGNWQGHHLDIFRAGGFDLAKVQIPKGYETTPEHVRELIAAGSRTVILRTDNCGIYPEQIVRDFEGRGFAELPAEYPGVTFLLEIGNEPDAFCPNLTPEQYRNGLIQSYDQLHDRWDVEWMASMCVQQACSDRVLADGRILSRYDALGLHLYGHYQLFDAYDNGWAEQLEEYQGLQIPIYLTEIGINDPDITGTDKAEAYHALTEEWGSRVSGFAFWTVSQDGRFPSYQIDAEMARIIGETGAACYEQTGYCVDPVFQAFYFEREDPIHDFGYPLGPARVETNPDGHTVLTQWFERSALEYHPDHAPEWQVLQRRLGVEIQGGN